MLGVAQHELRGVIARTAPSARHDRSSRRHRQQVMFRFEHERLLRDPKKQQFVGALGTRRARARTGRCLKCKISVTDAGGECPRVHLVLAQIRDEAAAEHPVFSCCFFLEQIEARHASATRSSDGGARGPTSITKRRIISDLCFVLLCPQSCCFF